MVLRVALRCNRRLGSSSSVDSVGNKLQERETMTQKLSFIGVASGRKSVN